MQSLNVTMRKTPPARWEPAGEGRIASPMSAPYLCQSDEQIAACFDVMRQLRPHLERPEFLERVRMQQDGGYELAALDGEPGVPAAVAGFRTLEQLCCGRVLYVDDLVTDEAVRSRGAGRVLLLWLADLGRGRGCDELHLDSGVQRAEAHRFYFRERMHITGYHFRLTLR